MYISIDEQEFSWTSEYDISVAGTQYSAKRHISIFSKHLDLFAENGDLIASIKSKFSPFKPHYAFEFTDGRKYDYWCEKIWKGVYICTGNGEAEFELYTHKGLRWSIFQRGKQIVGFRKNRLTVGQGNQYEIVLNSNANALVIVCMVLALNTSDGNDGNGTITYDFGHMGPEEQPYDESWRPS